MFDKAQPRRSLMFISFLFWSKNKKMQQGDPFISQMQKRFFVINYIIRKYNAQATKTVGSSPYFSINLFTNISLDSSVRKDVSLFIK